MFQSGGVVLHLYSRPLLCVVNFRCSGVDAIFASLAQLVEATDSKPVQSRFESEGWYGD